MKKTYIIPEVKLSFAVIEGFIAQSLKMQSGEISDESGVLSKEDGFWGDEDWD